MMLFSLFFNFEMVKYLSKHVLNGEVRDRAFVDSRFGDSEDSLLHSAMRGGDYVVVQMVTNQLGRLKAKSALTAVNNEGDTPLQVGVEEGKWEAVEWLVNFYVEGAKIDFEGNWDNYVWQTLTPLVTTENLNHLLPLIEKSLKKSYDWWIGSDNFAWLANSVIRNEGDGIDVPALLSKVERIGDPNYQLLMLFLQHRLALTKEEIGIFHV